MNATEVRRRLLSLLDHLPPDGVVITKRGQPLARIVPVQQPRQGAYVTGPLIKGGRPGPLCPTTENPYNLLFD